MAFIRKDTDYAFRALLHIAARSPSAATAEEVSLLQDIPMSFARKILRKLVAARVLGARAGRKGGFHLRKSPGRVSLLEVIEAIQGQVAVIPCVLSLEACPRRPACPLSQQWQQLQEEVLAFCRGTTLADVLDGSYRHRPAGGRLQKPPPKPSRRTRKTESRGVTKHDRMARGEKL